MRGLQHRHDKIQLEMHQCNRLIGKLQDKLAIANQELKLLTKHPVPQSIEEERAVREAVANQIKRRRGTSNAMDEPAQLPERRSFDKANIMELLKDLKHLLTPFGHILARLVAAKEPMPFKKLESVDDFIDGFQLTVPPEFTPLKLQGDLKDLDLEVLLPIK